jgi:hypothetical protein
MDRDRLFVETLHDLQERVSPTPKSEYDVLRAAGLLRQLLTDDAPLLHQVNRERRLTIRFRANVREPSWKKVPGLPAPVFWMTADGLDPASGFPGRQVEELPLDAFLAIVVMGIQDVELTVKDIIRQASHISGAVHAGTPSEESEVAMSALSGVIRVGGYDPVVKSLHAIGRVTVAALAPLGEQIEAGAD